MGCLLLEYLFVQMADKIEQSLVFIYGRQVLLSYNHDLWVDDSALEHLLSHYLVAKLHIGNSAEYEDHRVLWHFSIRPVSQSRLRELLDITELLFILELLANLHELSQVFLNVRLCPFFAFLRR